MWRAGYRDWRVPCSGRAELRLGLDRAGSPAGRGHPGWGSPYTTLEQSNNSKPDSESRIRLKIPNAAGGVRGWGSTHGRAVTRRVRVHRGTVLTALEGQRRGPLATRIWGLRRGTPAGRAHRRTPRRRCRRGPQPAVSQLGRCVRRPVRAGPPHAARGLGVSQHAAAAQAPPT